MSFTCRYTRERTQIDLARTFNKFDKGARKDNVTRFIYGKDDIETIPLFAEGFCFAVVGPILVFRLDNVQVLF